MHSQEYNPNKLCSFCGVPQSKFKCKGCKICYYCSKACQKKHWKGHKNACVTKTEKLKVRLSIPAIEPDRYYVCIMKVKGFEHMFCRQLELNYYPPSTILNQKLNMSYVFKDPIEAIIDVPRTDEDLSNILETAKKLGFKITMQVSLYEEFGWDNIFFIEIPDLPNR